jgi:hypothetical protein
LRPPGVVFCSLRTGIVLSLLKNEGFGSKERLLPVVSSFRGIYW